jgi:ribosomal-protein-alanine N-acetyltransferase
VAWIRLFAVASGITLARAWDELWPAAHARLKGYPQTVKAAAIPLQKWFRSLLDKSDFEYTHNVLVLSWLNTDLPATQRRSKAKIRPMEPDDLDTVQVVDEAAFGLVWQNSLSGLELAYRQAAVASVAEISGEIVGYQLSTATAMGGHLARLAVHPRMQGSGVGSDLLSDVLVQFKQRGAQSVTVNTQHDNLASLSLYKKAGFQLTGEEYPVYQYSL